MTSITPWPQSKPILTGAEIAAAIALQAKTINAELGDKPLIALCVLSGGLVYSGHLLPLLTMPLLLDVVRVTRYRDGTQGGDTLDWLVTPKMSLAGARVLLMDDIFDEGKTLEALEAWVMGQGASEVYSAVMVDKIHTRKPDNYRPQFIACQVPDEYVFGMGMDYQGAWRNANGIWSLA